MALDVGGRRIGVALSDTLRILASPLTTLDARPRAVALACISGLVDKHEVKVLVVGLPLTLSGEIGPQARLVQEFIEELRRLVVVPIYECDERLTSVEAERMMADAGVKPAERRARIDELAATIILRDYLESQRGREE
jgi:putative Holliday junction resolvase